MELQFQNQQREAYSAATKQGTFRNRSSSGGAANKNKFVGVRQRPSGKWVAEIKNTTQKIRMWLGTFDTAEEAARAYDEAACLLRGNNTRTNFIDAGPSNSSLSLKIRTLLNQKRASKQNLSFSSTTTITTTKTATATTINNRAKYQTTPLTSPPCSVSTSDSSQSSRDVILPPPPAATTSGSGGGGFMEQQQEKEEQEVFDGAYKPDLSYCCIQGGGGLEMGPSLQFDQSFAASEFDRFLLAHDGGGGGGGGGFEVPPIIRLPETTPMTSEPAGISPVFEHMKVERQISASLYAMNGVSEYWDNINDDDHSGDAFWDLPIISHMFCPS